MIIATAGHVDHGKTLLVNAITGIDTDRLDEEKQRGLTIDLGFAYTDAAPGCRLGFIDVPGHIKFINNMLAGVGAVDFALLVVAADDGPMPQTREHLAVLDLLQVSRGAVAMTKIDRVDGDRIAQVTIDIEDLLSETTLADAGIYPVSAVTGEGVGELTEALRSAAAALAQDEPEGHFRLAIDRCFSIKGTGLVVTGSVFAGQTGIGDTLYLTQDAGPGSSEKHSAKSAANNVPVRVRGIHTQDQAAKIARAGDRCALNITGQALGREIIHRGSWLVSNKAHRSTDRLDAQIKLLASETKALRHWTPVHVHAAASHVTGRVATLEGGQIDPGASGLVQIALSRPVNACRGDRLIIRDQGAARTLGGGTVIDPFSPKRGRTKPARLAHLAALGRPDTKGAIIDLLDVHPEGVYLPTLFDTFNLKDADGNELVRRAGAQIIAGHYAFSDKAAKDLKAAIVRRLEEWHKDNRQASGLSENQLRMRLQPRPPRIVLAALLEELIKASKVAKSGNVLQLPGHSAQLSEAEASMWAMIQPILAQSPTKPPVVHDLARQVNLAPATIEKLLARCVQVGYVVRPVKNRFFLPEGLATLKDHLFTLADRSPDGTFSASDYRDATGIGRNLSIDLLEYFDRMKITQRIGDRRRVLNAARPETGRQRS